VQLSSRAMYSFWVCQIKPLGTLEANLDFITHNLCLCHTISCCESGNLGYWLVQSIEYPTWQTSFGTTTESIGNKGLTNVL